MPGGLAGGMPAKSHFLAVTGLATHHLPLLLLTFSA